MMTFFYTHKKRVRRISNVPDCWNECTTRQTVQLAKIFEANVPLHVGKVMALRILLSKSAASFALLSDEAKINMLEHVGWVFEENNLTEQMLPQYKGLCGPKSQLKNLTIKELHACEMFYRMLRDKAPGALDKLVAVLYREPKKDYDLKRNKDGDVREDYNSNTVEYRLKEISKWPRYVKLAILFFYDGCRQYIIKRFPAVFDSNGQSSEEQFYGMFQLMRSLAADGKFGSFSEVENLNCYTALSEVTELVKEAKELETKYNQ